MSEQYDAVIQEHGERIAALCETIADSAGDELRLSGLERQVAELAQEAEARESRIEELADRLRELEEAEARHGATGAPGLSDLEDRVGTRLCALESSAANLAKAGVALTKSVMLTIEKGSANADGLKALEVRYETLAGDAQVPDRFFEQARLADAICSGFGQRLDALETLSAGLVRSQGLAVKAGQATAAGLRKLGDRHEGLVDAVGAVRELLSELEATSRLVSRLTDVVDGGESKDGRFAEIGRIQDALREQQQRLTNDPIADSAVRASGPDAMPNATKLAEPRREVPAERDAQLVIARAEAQVRAEELVDALDRHEFGEDSPDSTDSLGLESRGVSR